VCFSMLSSSAVACQPVTLGSNHAGVSSMHHRVNLCTVVTEFSCPLPWERPFISPSMACNPGEVSLLGGVKVGRHRPFRLAVQLAMSHSAHKSHYNLLATCDTSEASTTTAYARERPYYHGAFMNSVSPPPPLNTHAGARIRVAQPSGVWLWRCGGEGLWGWHHVGQRDVMLGVA
jgi:hypothetical protein